MVLLVSLGVTNTAGVICWFDWGDSLTASLILLIIFLGSHVSKVILGLCGDRRVSSNEGAYPIVHSTCMLFATLPSAKASLIARAHVGEDYTGELQGH